MSITDSLKNLTNDTLLCYVSHKRLVRSLQLEQNEKKTEHGYRAWQFINLQI